MRAFALNSDTGAVLWETNTWADPQKGSAATKHDRQYSTAAPRVMRTKAGKNVVTMSEAGTLGYGNHWIAGLDAIPASSCGASGRSRPRASLARDVEKRRLDDGRRRLLSYPLWDEKTNTLIAGTGDCYPSYDPEFRPGDNLYCASSVALDADSGELKWYFTSTPNERWTTTLRTSA